MKIFLRGLPDHPNPQDIQSFVQTVIAPPWYLPTRTQATIKSCEVLIVKNLDHGAVEFHGLIDIWPPKVALLAIQQLHNSQFKGYRLQARKWHARSALNDRRHPYRSSDHGTEGGHRYRQDRRRSNLLVEIYTPLQIQGLKQFHREYSS